MNTTANESERLRQLDLLQCRARLVAVRILLREYNSGLYGSGASCEPGELLDALEASANGSAPSHWLPERVAAAQALRMKAKAAAERRARRDGVCPCCGGKADMFQRVKCPGMPRASWTWRCPEGCNP